MARIILHIGTHKTGTTGMQRALFAQREQLSRNGICYDPWPACLSGTKYAHHGLAHRLARFDPDDRKVLDKYRLRIERGLARGEDVIISAEPFYRQIAAGIPEDPDRARIKFLDRTADYFADFPVEISICFRRPDCMAESMFKEQAVSIGNEVDFLPWLNKCAMRFDYSARIREFEERFGTTKVWCFEDAITRGLITSFFDEHGLNFSGLSDAKADRKSLSCAATMWLLRANQSEQDMSVSERRVRWYYAVSQHAHARLKLVGKKTFWADAETRDDFISVALTDFSRRDFWTLPTDNPDPVTWSKKNQDEVTSHYEKWLTRNQILLKMRKDAKLSPYDPDSKIPLKKRFRYLPWQIKDWLRR